MKLLIVTQKVDREDPILGFFHRWIEEFAKHCEKVSVICLEEGQHNFPSNVLVYSLGKENGVSKMTYVIRFYQLIIKLRNEYDTVFVHMNQEYVLLGGSVWKMLDKRLTLWRNHTQGTVFTRCAIALSDEVFCTSPQSFTAKFEKTKIMPVGIETTLYDDTPDRESKTILFFGRISKVKNIHIFIKALIELGGDGVDFRADIIGSPVTSEDAIYERMVREMGRPLVDAGKLFFRSGMTHDETHFLYGKYSLYINLTPDGSLDKTILEAMASRTPVLVSNSAFDRKIPDMCIIRDIEPSNVSYQIRKLLSLDDDQEKELGETLCSYVHATQGLKSLVSLLIGELSRK